MWIIVMLMVCSLPLSAQAAISSIAGGGTWSTSFQAAGDCVAGAFDYPENVCGGVESGGYGACETLSESQITADANYSGGAGGYGFRMYIGADSSPPIGTAVPVYTFSGSDTITEFWARTYIRYANNYGMNGDADEGGKQLYFASSNGYDQWAAFQRNEAVYYEQGAPGGDSYYSATGHGWQDIFGAGTDTSNNAWHRMEWHLKRDTNNADGVLELKVDGVLILTTSTAKMGMNGTGHYTSLTLTNNQTGGASACQPIDIDDVAFSTAGWIGAYGGADTTPPAVPTGVYITQR